MVAVCSWLGGRSPAGVLAASQAGGSHSTVAVLEYRAGTRGLPRIASRLAARMARLTSHRVLSPTDARRILGAGVDARVAGCRGDPSCIGGIGDMLGADQVMLVGISQMGDLILAIQLIDCATGRVLAREADSLEPDATGVQRDRLDRYLRSLLPADDFRRFGTVVVKTGVPGDRVFVDGTLRGMTPLAPLVLPAPGRYRLRVTRPGHQDFDATLDVLPDARLEVTPRLSPRAGPLPWYQKWWVWALVGAAVTGGVTAAVVAATASPPSTVPAVVKLDR